MNEIVMPKLSDTMTEGRLVSWKKRVGETVRRGEVIAEVETDKANMELESFVSGELLEIKVQEGEMVQVGTVIAVIGAAQEKGAAQPATGAKPGASTEAGGAEEKGAGPEGQAPAAAKPEPESKQEPKPKPEPKPEPEPEPEPELGDKGEPTAAQPVPPAVTAGESARAEDIVPMDGEKQAPAAPPKPGVEEVQPAGEPGEGYRAEEPPLVPSPGPAKGGEQREGATAAGTERAAPVVRRRARELGVDLAQVSGSGPEGRILLEDLERFAKGGAPQQAPRPELVSRPAAAQPKEKPEERAGMPRLRAAVAKTVIESWAKIPHFTVTMDITMDEAESVRRQLKQNGMPVTVNDLIVKGVTLALQRYSQMNGSYAAEGIMLHSDINISVAVGVPDGVLMPVVTRCQERSLAEISEEAKRLVEKARSGSLSEQEMQGGTFSVSNLGMFGVSSFSAIIHPSQSGVLAVGAVVETAMSCSGVLGTAKVMKVTLSADHRVVDGAYAAQFLAEFKNVMENPVRLLI